MSAIKVEHPYAMLLTEEERIILKTRKVREDMIDGIIEYNHGVPTKTGDVRVMNEVLNSLDSQVLGLADTRLKQSNADTQGDLADTIKAVLLQVDNNVTDGTPIDTTLPEQLVPKDLVPGEDEIEYNPIELDTIIDEG